MQISSFAQLGLVLVLGFSFIGCSHTTIQKDQSIVQSSYQPLPSRQVQQDHHGYYYLRTGLATEYTSNDSSEERMRRDLQAVRDSGAYFLRVGIHWNETEVAPDQFNWTQWDLLFRLADEYQVTLLPYLSRPPEWVNSNDPTRFAHFAKKVATRYQGRVPSWELWNEPDLDRNWSGSPEAFVQVVSLAASAIREVDTDVKVVLGGMAKPIESSFFKTLLDRTGFGEQFDVFNFRVSLDRYPTTLLQVKHLVQFRAPGRDLWFAGFGAPNIEANEQAKALWKSHILAASTESVSLTAWYPIGDTVDSHLGLLTLKGEKKPAFSALQFFNRVFDQPFRSVTHRVRIEKKKNSSLWIEAYEKKDGQWIITAGLKNPDRSASETFDLNLPQVLSRARLNRFTSTGQLISSEASSTHIANQKIRGSELWIATLRPEQQLSSQDSK